MKLRVIKQFLDKFDRRIVYEPSQVIEIDDKDRCDDMLSRGLCEAVEPAETPGENPKENEPGTKKKQPSKKK